MKRNPERKEILIIKNHSDEGPGIIQDIIMEPGISFRIVDLSRENIVQGVENYGAVIILGGPDSANDSNEKMKNELALIRKITQAGIPYLGICLGMQTFVKALGGQVVKSQVKEVGFRDPAGDFFRVDLTEEGQSDPLFAGLDPSFGVFHLHGETVILPADIKLLATGKFCRNQVVKAGSNSYGIQSHLELTPAMFEDWINSDPDLLKLDKKTLLSDFEITREQYARTGYLLFRNFLRIAKYI